MPNLFFFFKKKLVYGVLYFWLIFCFIKFRLGVFFFSRIIIYRAMYNPYKKGMRQNTKLHFVNARFKAHISIFVL